MLDTWIDGEYNCQAYGGCERSFKNMSRIEVWNSSITAVRKASESDLNLMLMKTTRKQKIKRNGVHITVCGEKYWFTNPLETLNNLEREVYVRYDPADFRTVRLYEADTDRFLFEWPLADVLMVNYLTQVQDELSDAQEQINSVKKFAREQAKQQKTTVSKGQRITMLETEKRRAAAKLASGFEIRMPKNITLVRTDEEIPQKQAVGAEQNTVHMNLKLMRENTIKMKRKEE